GARLPVRHALPIAPVARRATRGHFQRRQVPRRGRISCNIVLVSWKPARSPRARRKLWSAPAERSGDGALAERRIGLALAALRTGEPERSRAALASALQKRRCLWRQPCFWQRRPGAQERLRVDREAVKAHVVRRGDVEEEAAHGGIDELAHVYPR